MEPETNQEMGQSASASGSFTVEEGSMGVGDSRSGTSLHDNMDIIRNVEDVLASTSEESAANTSELHHLDVAAAHIPSSNKSTTSVKSSEVATTSTQPGTSNGVNGFPDTTVCDVKLANKKSKRTKTAKRKVAKRVAKRTKLIKKKMTKRTTKRTKLVKRKPAKKSKAVSSRRRRVNIADVSQVFVVDLVKDPYNEVKFNSYLRQVLKSQNPTMTLGGSTCEMLDNMVKNIVANIAEQAVTKLGKRKTLSEKQLQRAVKMSLPKGLRDDVHEYATIAVAKFKEQKLKKRSNRLRK